jgi:hypothetical protein
MQVAGRRHLQVVARVRRRSELLLLLAAQVKLSADAFDAVRANLEAHQTKFMLQSFWPEGPSCALVWVIRLLVARLFRLQQRKQKSER